MPRPIAEKVGEGIAPAKDIGGSIHNQIFVVQPSHQPPGHQGVNAVVNADLNIFVGGEREKVRVLFHAQKTANSVHNNFYWDTTIGGIKQCCQQCFSTDIGAKIKGGEDNALLCPPDHAHALDKCPAIVLKNHSAILCRMIHASRKCFWSKTFFIFVADLWLWKPGDQHTENKVGKEGSEGKNNPYAGLFLFFWQRSLRR